MILRLPETQRCRDACGSGLHGIRADPSPAQELPRAFECPKPFLERRQDSDDDVLLCPERRRRIWRLLAKPKQARNFKDLKHLKGRYTFRIRAQKPSGWKTAWRKGPSVVGPPILARHLDLRPDDRWNQNFKYVWLAFWKTPTTTPNPATSSSIPSWPCLPSPSSAPGP